MYAPICELRKNSTTLPLRSRTSRRLRALTVTCLPRDRTRAGVHHLANNPRHAHDPPEGHHGELVEQVWANRHTRQSSGLADPGPRRDHPDPRAFRSGRTLGRGRHRHVPGSCSTGSLRRRHGHHPDRLRQQRSRQHHPRQRITNRYQLQLASLTRPRTIPWPPRASSARSARRTFRPSRSLSLPHGQFVRQACAAADAVRPTLGRGRMATPTNDPYGQANCPGRVLDSTTPISVNRLAIVVLGGPPTISAVPGVGVSGLGGGIRGPGSLPAAGERRRWPIWLRVVSGVCDELRQMPAGRPVALVPHSNVGLFIAVIGSGPRTSYAARGGWGR